MLQAALCLASELLGPSEWRLDDSRRAAEREDALAEPLELGIDDTCASSSNEAMTSDDYRSTDLLQNGLRQP